jgi:hypothetical protein
MMIRILYSDGRYDMVIVSQLDRLIAAHRISGFRRATGWVFIGRDPIRKNSKKFHLGPERRHPSGRISHPEQKKTADFAALSSQENRQNRYQENDDG